MFTREQWSRDLLTALGNSNPVQNVVDFIVGWTVAETNTDSGAKFNLLNTTEPASDATDFNSVHVKNYTSYREGIIETVHTLENGFYPHLLSALSSNIDQALLGPIQAILNELNTWSGGANYGHAFISLGQAHRGDPFNYGSAEAVNNPAPAPVATANQLEAAHDCWQAFADGVGEKVPPMGTGIFDSWLQHLIQGRQFGPPLGTEYPSVDWNGEAIVVQEFARARAEWKDGQCKWYGVSGEIV